MPVGHRSPGDTCLEAIAVGQRISCEVTSVTPAPDADAFAVCPRLIANPIDRRLQILQFDASHLAMDLPRIGDALSASRAIIAEHNRVALAAQELVPPII